MYSLSTSASASSSTGPIQFGNVKSGSIGLPAWVLPVIIAVCVLGGVVVFALFKKK